MMRRDNTKSLVLLLGAIENAKALAGLGGGVLRETIVNPAKAICIGTMNRASEGWVARYIAALAGRGFESFEPFFWQTTNGQNLAGLGKRCLHAFGDRDITVLTPAMFGDPREDQLMDRQSLQGWKDRIYNTHHFGANCVAGLTGRIRGKPLTERLGPYTRFWSELAKRVRARESGLHARIVRWVGTVPAATGTLRIIRTPRT